MSRLSERRRRGEDICKKYRAISGTDAYACATDAIGDILLAVAKSEQEAARLLHAAEIDFRNAAEAESFMAEG